MPNSKTTAEIIDQIVIEHEKALTTAQIINQMMAEKELKTLSNMCVGNGTLTAGNSGGVGNLGTIIGPNTGGYSINPSPGVLPFGGISPNQWVTRNNNVADQFPAGLVRDRVEEYLCKREKEVMRGRFEHDFISDVLGLTLEELKDGWYMLKDGEEMTKDLILCSSVRGRQIPLLHQCKEGGKYYSKTDTNMSKDQIWCMHCEKDLPEDLETMLAISYVL